MLGATSMDGWLLRWVRLSCLEGWHICYNCSDDSLNKLISNVL
jgi:hypothetical protein